MKTKIASRALLGAMLALGAATIAPPSARAQDPARPDPFDEEVLRLRAVVDALRREVAELQGIRATRGAEEPGEALRIGVVDLERAIAGYERKVRFEGALNEAREHWKEELEPLRAELAKAREEGSADAIAAAEAALADARDAVEGRLRAHFDHAFGILLDDIRAAAARWGKKAGYDLVLTTSPPPGWAAWESFGRTPQLLYASAKRDVTDAVLVELNADPRAKDSLPPLPAGAAPRPTERPTRRLVETPATERPIAKRSLRTIFEDVLPPAIARSSLVIKESRYADEPASIAAQLGEPWAETLSNALGSEIVATASMKIEGAGVRLLGIETVGRLSLPDGRLRSLSPFDFVTVGERWTVFVERDPGWDMAYFRAALVPIFGEMTSAAAYDELVLAAVEDEVRGVTGEDGFRVTDLPPEGGLLAGWIAGRPDIRIGDVIQRINGYRVGPDATVAGLYRRFARATTFEIELVRDGVTRVVHADVWPARSAADLAERLDRFVPEVSRFEPWPSAPGNPIRPIAAGRGRHTLADVVARDEVRAGSSFPSVVSWAVVQSDNPFSSIIERRVLGEQGELYVLVAELESAEMLESQMKRLGDPGGFEITFAIGRFVLALGGSREARSGEAYWRFVADVRAWVDALGGRVVRETASSGDTATAARLIAFMRRLLRGEPDTLDAIRYPLQRGRQLLAGKLDWSDPADRAALEAEWGAGDGPGCEIRSFRRPTEKEAAQIPGLEEGGHRVEYSLTGSTSIFAAYLDADERLVAVMEVKRAGR